MKTTAIILLLAALIQVNSQLCDQFSGLKEIMHASIYEVPIWEDFYTTSADTTILTIKKTYKCFYSVYDFES